MKICPSQSIPQINRTLRQNFCWYSSTYSKRRNILSNYGTSCYHCSLPNSNTMQNCYIRANPYTVLYINRTTIRFHRSKVWIIIIMTTCPKRNIRSNINVFTDIDSSTPRIQNTIISNDRTFPIINIHGARISLP